MRLPALLALAAALSAGDADLWSTRVLPLLTERCIECHGPQKAKHGLRLDTIEGIRKGGKDLGPAVVAGKPDESPLIRVLVMARSEELAMPPKDPALTAEQIAMLRTWIAAGAVAPAAATP